MDRRLRELERQAALGDPQALRRLLRERARSGAGPVPFDPDLPRKQRPKQNIRQVPLSKTGKAGAKGRRPRSRIVAREKKPGAVTTRRVGALLPLPDGRLLVGVSTVGADSRSWVEIRRGPKLELERTLLGVSAPLLLSPDGRLLLSGGTLWEGYPSSVNVVDLLSFDVIEVPLHYPFAWTGDTSFVGHLPRFEDYSEQVDWADLEPHLQDYYRRRHGAQVDPDLLRPFDAIAALLPRYQSEPVQMELKDGAVNRLKHARAKLEAVAFAPESGRLYVSSGLQVRALYAGREVWKRKLPGKSWYKVAGLYPDPLGRWLAVTLQSHENQPDKPTLFVLEAGTGQVLYKAKLATWLGKSGLQRVERRTDLSALIWHPAGWFAVGSSDGLVAHVNWSHQQVRVYRGSQGRVGAFCWAPGHDRLVVGGQERPFNLRIFPLFSDEAPAG